MREQHVLTESSAVLACLQQVCATAAPWPCTERELAQRLQWPAIKAATILAGLCALGRVEWRHGRYGLLQEDERAPTLQGSGVVGRTSASPPPFGEGGASVWSSATHAESRHRSLRRSLVVTSLRVTGRAASTWEHDQGDRIILTNGVSL